METVLLLYAVLLFWLLGGFEPPKPQAKPKTPEEDVRLCNYEIPLAT